MKAGVRVGDVRNVTIFGNHSATQVGFCFVKKHICMLIKKKKVPDANSASIRIKGSFKPATEVINDQAWLRGEFVTTVQKRGAAVIEARKLSSAMSAANAIADHLRTWLVGFNFFLVFTPKVNTNKLIGYRYGTRNDCLHGCSKRWFVRNFPRFGVFLPSHD